jgi:hypothetical protein
LKQTILFIAFLFTICSHSQKDTTTIVGQIYTENETKDSIIITNISNKTKTISTNNGQFRIKVKLSDTLVFNGANIIEKTHIINELNFSTNILNITIDSNSILIKEILISNKNTITAVSLGLVSKNQKKYTVAERRIASVGSLVSIGGLISLISGQRKQLLAEREIEKKLELKTKIASQFSRDYMNLVFKIPKEHIDGYLFYICEDKKLSEIYKTKDKFAIEFRLTELATEYLLLKEVKTKN